MEKRGDRRIGRAIAARRRERGMRQRDLAVAVGTSAGYLGHIECGVHRPSARLLRAILIVLGVDGELPQEPAP